MVDDADVGELGSGALDNAEGGEFSSSGRDSEPGVASMLGVTDSPILGLASPSGWPVS